MIKITFKHPKHWTESDKRKEVNFVLKKLCYKLYKVTDIEDDSQSLIHNVLKNKGLDFYTMPDDTISDLCKEPNIDSTNDIWLDCNVPGEVYTLSFRYLCGDVELGLFNYLNYIVKSNSFHLTLI